MSEDPKPPGEPIFAAAHPRRRQLAVFSLGLGLFTLAAAWVAALVVGGLGFLTLPPLPLFSGSRSHTASHVRTLPRVPARRAIARERLLSQVAVISR